MARRAFEQMTGGRGQHVFISYRRNGGDDLAHLIYRELRRRCYSVFLDVKQLAAGHFGDDLKKELAASCCVLLILTQSEIRDPANPSRVITTTTLDRCKDPNMRDNDWVRKEIVFALQNDTPIIPVLKDFRMPDEYGRNEYPEDMRGLFDYNGVKWDHELSNGTMERLCQFIKAAVQRKCQQWNVPPEIFYQADASVQVYADGAARELQQSVRRVEAERDELAAKLAAAEAEAARLRAERNKAAQDADRLRRERDEARGNRPGGPHEQPAEHASGCKTQYPSAVAELQARPGWVSGAPPPAPSPSPSAPPPACPSPSPPDHPRLRRLRAALARCEQLQRADEIASRAPPSASPPAPI
eukprot:tig00021038_g17586.t1